MFENLDIFRLSHAMATHAGARQTVVAQNMANADTPGYQARDLPRFQDLLSGRNTTLSQTATRDKHLNHSEIDSGFPSNLRPFAASDPNGNSVSVELEMLHAVEARRQHNQALAIYKSNLNILRTAIAKR